MGLPQPVETGVGGGRALGDPPPRCAFDSAYAFFLAAAGVVGSWWLAWHSDGVYHDDDLTHFHIARWAWTDPRQLLSVWGRPGCTLFYFPSAVCGWTAARMFSGLMTGVTAWMTYRIAGRLGFRWNWLAPALFWLCPLAFSLSYSTVTEMPAAFYLTAALLLFLRGNHAWSAAFLSLTFVTRYECVVLAPFWLLFWWSKGRPAREWLWLLWAPAAHNLLGRVFLGSWPMETFFVPRPTTYYGQSGWLYMPAQLALSVGTGGAILAAAGVREVWRARGGSLVIVTAAAYLGAHVLIYRFGLFGSGGYARFLVPLAPMAAVAAVGALSAIAASVRRDQTRSYRAADGFDPSHQSARAAPLLATALVAQIALWFAVDVHDPSWMWWGMRWPLSAALAIAWVASYRADARREIPPGTSPKRAFDGIPCPARGPDAAVASDCDAGRDGPPRPAGRSKAGRIAAIAAALAGPGVLMVVALGQVASEARPHRLVEDQLLIRDAAEWMKLAGVAVKNWYGPNQWLFRFLDRSQTIEQPRTREALKQLVPGEFFIWDANYCPHPDHAVSLDAMRARRDFREVWHGREHSRLGVYCRIFERIAAASSPASAAATREHGRE